MTIPSRIGIIGGSGLGSALHAKAIGNSVQVETPFGPPSANVLLTEWAGVPIAFIPRHGVGHTISPSAVPFRANIWALKSVGCKWILASGAVGSLREEFAPRDLVIPDQIIDRTTRREGSFFSERGEGAVHVEFADPFCATLRSLLIEAGGSLSGKTHPTGTYVCMEGPAFSTRAESRMHRQWGGDLIGMTAMPEAKLAREAEIAYAMIALVTDYDCWRPEATDRQREKTSLLAEIIANMNAASGRALLLFERVLPDLWARRDEAFEGHSSLQLAIWTSAAVIAESAKVRLAPLWGKYLKP
jgi:5'-methylthioadenosine phosphorylase